MKHIVMFGGGSGSRDITMALCGARHAVTRVVPAWDSGGSSRAIRAALGMLAIGDIRQALMTLAHGEERAGSVVRFCNARLSDVSMQADLQAEFDFYASGAHPLLGQMEPGIRQAILDYLRMFRSSIGANFDFRRGSIGNFVLAGAYLAHDRDINTAIFIFRKLCAIDGHVWPSTTSDRVELSATLRDGHLIRGQDQVTALNAEQARVGINGVQLTQPGAGAAGFAGPAANPAVLKAIGMADAILFGPGSFYTSTLAHLSVSGIGAALAATAPAVPKIFIGNILECPETTGRTLAELVQALARAGGPGLLTHVFVNRGWVPFERVVQGFCYLREGSGAPSPEPGVQILADDFEDPWNRGRHDAPKVMASLSQILDRHGNICRAGPDGVRRSAAVHAAKEASVAG
ncbi:MAG: YvcK family protein [Rhodoferax sp.]|jgi:CofD-related protein of GAK system|nr:YvcK family protein [Rhodoferax sp.]